MAENAPQFRVTDGQDEWTVEKRGWPRRNEQGWVVLGTNLTLEQATSLVQRQEAKQR